MVEVTIMPLFRAITNIALLTLALISIYSRIHITATNTSDSWLHEQYKDFDFSKDFKHSFFNLKETVPPIYWINLDSDFARRKTFVTEMHRIGVTQYERISAINFDGSGYKVKTKDTFKEKWGWDKRLAPVTIKEFSVTVTHMTAIRRAVENAEKYNNTYALILEDDVGFPFDIDFNALIASAPSDFTILQLETCNENIVKPAWEQFKKNQKEELDDGNKTANGSSLWKKHDYNRESAWAWGLQGYILNTENAKKKWAYNDAVKSDHESKMHMLKWKPYELEEYCSTWKLEDNFGPGTKNWDPKMCCNSINPEINIYQNMFPPTYLSKVPLVRHGAFESDMHKDQDKAKREAAKMMWNLVFQPIQKGLYDQILPASLRQTRSIAYRKLQSYRKRREESTVEERRRKERRREERRREEKRR